MSLLKCLNFHEITPFTLLSAELYSLQRLELITKIITNEAYI